MNDFKELDLALQITSDGRWYIGVKPGKCEYLHEDLKLYVETVNPITGEYTGLWGTELEALAVCKQYYIMHARLFPYTDRYAELCGVGTTNTTSDESQHMVFK